MFKLQHTFLTSLLLQASSLKIMFKFLPIFATLGIAAVLALPFDILNPIPNPLKALPFDPLNPIPNPLKALPFDPLNQVQNALKPNDNSQANSQENNSNNSSDKNHSNNNNSGSQDLFHVVDKSSKIVDLHKFVGSIEPTHLEDQLKKVINGSAHLVEQIKQQLHSKYDDLEKASEINNSIKHEVEDIINNALDKLENKINNTLTHVNEKTSEIVNYVRNVTEETVQEFINKTDQAEAAMSELVKELAHNLLDNINGVINNTIYGIENQIHSILSNIKYIIRLPLENGFNITADLAYIIKNFLENVEQQIDNVTSVASEIFDSVHNVVKFGIDDTRNNIKNVFKVAQNIEDNIQDTIAEHIIDDIEDKVSHVFK